MKKSKFSVRTRNFQFKLRKRSIVNEPIRWNNYITDQQLEISTSFKVEISTSQLEISSSISGWKTVGISSWNVEISSLKKSKFPVRTRNFQFKLRKRSMVNEPIRWNNYITDQQLEISTSSNWKFRVQSGNYEFQTGNFDIPTGNFEFKLEISTSANWKFLHPNWTFRVQTRNFDFGKLEISTSQLEISSSNSKFRVAFQARMWHQYAFVPRRLPSNTVIPDSVTPQIEIIMFRGGGGGDPRIEY